MVKGKIYREICAQLFMMKGLLPTAGFGSGAGSGTAAGLGSGTLNTTITNRLV